MKNYFSKILNQKIISIVPVNGGDINDAIKITTDSGVYFVKTNQVLNAIEIFDKEVRNLNILNEIVNVPEVIKTGQFKNKSFLILKWIDQSNADDTISQDLAYQLVKLHRTSNQYFGLNYDNYIGTLPQINTNTNNWLEFYFTNRIENQLRLAVNANLMQKKYIGKSVKMFSKIEHDYPNVFPVLLHGDLWSGNLIYNRRGKATFIDPAIYYGFREMDIAMMKLFGGFNQDVFDIYNELLPLDHDWQMRIKFHQLYYLLVHVNLFGGGYITSAENIIDYYS